MCVCVIIRNNAAVSGGRRYLVIEPRAGPRHVRTRRGSLGSAYLALPMMPLLPIYNNNNNNNITLLLPASSRADTNINLIALVLYNCLYYYNNNCYEENKLLLFSYLSLTLNKPGV